VVQFRILIYITADKLLTWINQVEASIPSSGEFHWHNGKLPCPHLPHLRRGHNFAGHQLRQQTPRSKHRNNKIDKEKKAKAKVVLMMVAYDHMTANQVPVYRSMNTV
jgi:hypothetical protein